VSDRAAHQRTTISTALKARSAHAIAFVVGGGAAGVGAALEQHGPAIAEGGADEAFGPALLEQDLGAGSRVRVGLLELDMRPWGAVSAGLSGGWCLPVTAPFAVSLGLRNATTLLQRSHPRA
jgi:hypothetical protein